MSHEPDRPGKPNPANDATRVNRRGFLQLATALVTGATVACKTSPRPASTLRVPPPDVPPRPTGEQYPEVPPTPAAPPTGDRLAYFTTHEARTVDALASRILPGSPDDPGAHEAGVVTYIDSKMQYNDGFATHAYMHPPFAKTYDGARPPADAGGHVWVKKSELERYGYQTALTPRQVYRLGLEAIDRYCRQTYGKDFVGLTAAQQDDVVGKFADELIPTFTEPTAGTFWDMLRGDIVEGMFCDPVYGGNQGLVGWKLVGYPGAQRAYTPRDLATEDVYSTRAPQSIVHLPVFKPGQPANDDVTIPVSGFTLQNKP